MKISDTKLIPFITTQQMIEVDRAMIDDFNISLVQMMEQAGAHLAELVCSRFFPSTVTTKHIQILAGAGGNGGGVLVAARYLFQWGATVSVYLGQTTHKMSPVAAQQWVSLRDLGIPCQVGLPSTMNHERHSDLILDGLIGYSLHGTARAPIAQLIRWANQQRCPVVAMDIPSGLDATTGKATDPTINATATLTLALPKKGLQSPSARSVVGELYLADIGVPTLLYARPPLGLVIPELFAQQAVLRLW